MAILAPFLENFDKFLQGRAAEIRAIHNLNSVRFADYATSSLGNSIPAFLIGLQSLHVHLLVFARPSSCTHGRVYPSIPFYTLLYPSIPFYTLLYPSIPFYTLLYPSIPFYTLLYPSRY